MNIPANARRLVLILTVIALAMTMPLSALAHAPATPEIDRVWQRTDQPVAAGAVSRSWIWGPEAFTAACDEPYLDSPDGFRLVQYFEKSRMEINNPGGDPDSEWYVTQGLLAREMITGEMQVGDVPLIDWGPAEVYSAGDPGGGAPNYARFAPLMDVEPLAAGSTITQTLAEDGTVGSNPALANYGVVASEYVEATNHRVASVFWEFMNSQGPIDIDGVPQTGPLFENPFYGVGLPITEAYWSRVVVAGTEQDVLIQAFERRVLTYTPDNPDGWQVEAGNVGQHYYIWRYGVIPVSGTACPNTLEVTFNVYEQQPGGAWEQIALVQTHEVWHPNDVATGIWRTYAGSQASGSPNSAGTLVADHNYAYVFGGNFLVELDAQVEQYVGPTGGSASIYVSDFTPGHDLRAPGSVFVANGVMTYDTGTESDTITYEVAGTITRVFHVFLDGPAPPVFFR